MGIESGFVPGLKVYLNPGLLVNPYPDTDKYGTNETRNIERITYILHLSTQQQNSILNNNISRISPAHIKLAN